jgi:transposase
MPGRRLPTLDIRTLLIHLRTNASDRDLNRTTGLARRTLARYRQWAQQHHLLEGELPPLEALQLLLEQTLPTPLPPQNHSSVEPFREAVVKLRRENVEMKAILARLKERGYAGSYASVRRFVQTLEPKTPDAVVRVETRPGEEAQVDFGEVGRLYDPVAHRSRKVYAFVMTLSWSRHQYVEFVFDQKLPTWLSLHGHAFTAFDGVPHRVVTDNLTPAIIEADPDNVMANRAYAECAQHYGFRIAPCRPRTPQHKGKVESGVHFVQRNFWAGRELTDLDHANTLVRTWCAVEAGERVHGTTKEPPKQRFEQTEHERLLPLPPTSYDLTIMKQAKLHRDCYVVFDNAFYSAPFRLVGQKLWVRGGLRQVRLYTPDYRLVATHERATQPGQRLTHPDHLPPHKLAGLQQTHQSCRELAQQIGPATHQIVAHLLSDPIVERLQSAGRLVRLADTYSTVRLEAACVRALLFDDPCYTTVKRILQKELDTPPESLAAPLPSAIPTDYAFSRSVEELFGAQIGALTWN